MRICSFISLQLLLCSARYLASLNEKMIVSNCWKKNHKSFWKWQLYQYNTPEGQKSLYVNENYQRRSQRSAPFSNLLGRSIALWCFVKKQVLTILFTVCTLIEEHTEPFNETLRVFLNSECWRLEMSSIKKAYFSLPFMQGYHFLTHRACQSHCYFFFILSHIVKPFPVYLYCSVFK